MWILLIAFVGIPLAEIALFIEVGGWIGFWPTLLTVVATAVLGTALLRMQGLHTLKQAQKSVEQGEMPVEHIFTGACLLVAGALLLTPGFFTDSVGFLLFVPMIPRLLGNFAIGTFVKRSAQGHWQRGFESDAPTIIDAEYSEVSSKKEGGDRNHVNPENRITRRPHGK